jgi:pSer/pThr/pTyr-binding forkhead associated (FHA) protein
MPALGTPPATPAAPAAPAAPPTPVCVAWLLNRLTPPLQLFTGRTVLVGRGPDSGLVLDHPSVSRRHAGLRIDGGGKIVLADLGSSNGTLLNGRRITQPVVVQPGDTIEVGPFELLVGPAARAPKAPQDRRGLSETSEDALVEAELSGRIGKVGLAEIAQVIELNTKTGTLRVEANGTRGEVVVVQGKPVAAKFGAATDAAAVLAILKLQSGTFQLVATVDERLRMTMGTTFSALIMEAARADDEHRRSRAHHVESEAQAFFSLDDLQAPASEEKLEKTSVLSRHRRCPHCRQMVDAILERCQKCGASFIAKPPKE